MEVAHKKSRYVNKEDPDLKKEDEIVEVDTRNAAQYSVQGVAATVNARGSITSDRPHCEVRLTKTYVTRTFQMHIPKTFAKQHLPNISTDFTICNVKGEKWRVQYNYSSSRSWFNCGWKTFAIDNFLQIGDCCRFELVDKYEMVCHINPGLTHNSSDGTTTRRRGENIYAESSKRGGKHKLVAEVPPAGRRVTKRTSPCNVSGQSETVGSFLQSMYLNKYSDIFEEEEIDIAALKLMTDDDLKDLRIPMGPRKKILNALESFN